MDKNICAFLDETAYTIDVEFNPKSGNSKRYQYVTNIPNLAVGDLVIVPVGSDIMMQLANEDNIKKSLRYDKAWREDVRTEVEDIFEMDVTLVPHGGIDQSNLKVVKVLKVDVDVNIPPNQELEIRWVIAKLDLDYVQQLLARNRETSKLVEAAYKQRVRRTFKEQILGELGAAEIVRIKDLMGGK